MSDRLKTTDLDEPADFYMNDRAEPERFRTLGTALARAIGVPEQKREYTAHVITRSGDRYGWNEIKELYQHYGRAKE